MVNYNNYTTLITQYTALNQLKINKNKKKIVIPNSFIEIFCDSSFYMQPKEKDEPNITLRIAQSEIIDNLPFESIKNTLYYKNKMGRDKDLNDIKIIEA